MPSKRGHNSSVGLSCVPEPWGSFSGLLAKHYKGTQCQRLRRISEVDAVHSLDFLLLPFAFDAFVVTKWLRHQRLRWQLKSVKEVPCVLIHASLSPPSVTWYWVPFVTWPFCITHFINVNLPIWFLSFSSCVALRLSKMRIFFFKTTDLYRNSHYYVHVWGLQFNSWLNNGVIRPGDSWKQK